MPPQAVRINNVTMAVHKKYNKNVLGRGLDDLGKGLDALIDTNGVTTQGTSTINEIPLNELNPTRTSPDAILTRKHCKSWPQASAR